MPQQSPTQDVHLATGRAAEELAAAVRRLGLGRLLLVAGSRRLVDELTAGLPVAACFHDVAMHVPAGVVDRAEALALRRSVDGIVCIGGGSATGLAKAVAVRTGLPIVAVPTTYAGSEATPVWGITDAGGKHTASDPRALPRTVVYDAALTLTLPAAYGVASGLNALAHCVDSLWAPRATPETTTRALEGAALLARTLPRVAEDGTDLPAREDLLRATHLAGAVFADAGSGLHHKICHVLGGLLDLPHAETHAAVLPHVLAFNAPAVPELDARLATALAGGVPGGSTTRRALDELEALYARLRPTRALRDLGMPADAVPAVVEAVLASGLTGNPVPLTAARLDGLLRAAWGAPA
ncbi:MAG: maleylacetate reductase [Nocardioides alkalitolerans]